MEKKRISIFKVMVIILLAMLAGVNVYLWQYQRLRIAYIRSHDLIERYHGTIAARSGFEKKKASMLSNVDSLRLDFERARNAYISRAAGLSPRDRAAEENKLGQQQDQLMQYSDVIDQKIDEEDSRMMQEVLNQVNSFVEEYAKREGHDIVLGTTLSGNLLFGERSLDITDQVLQELNNRYQGK